MKQDTFVLPHVLSVGHVDKIVIVAMIGRSAFSSNCQKTKPLGRVFGGEANSTEEIVIEGLYDETNQLIYLHLQGLYDTAKLIENYNDLAEKYCGSSEDADFLSIYTELKSSYARAMLLLFHISHIIVVSHPGYTFDLSYIQLFKALEVARQKCAGQVSDILNSIPDVSSEWLSHRRLCTPRVVFYFDSCPRQLRSPCPVATVKKLEHAIEDKIYHVLRKSKIIINNSSNCLFAIPPNQEYVFMNTEKDPMSDRLAHSVHSLLQSCQPLNVSPEASLGFTYTLQSDVNLEKRSFLKFLQVHTNHAFVKGFDDNMGRNISRAHFEMPNVDIWFQVVNKLYGYFCDPKESKSVRGLSLLNTDTRFSEQRCLKVLPLALARYQENLPPHYTRAYHETRLAMALAVFTNHARGPMFDKYSKQLIDDCKQHFENGRQLCEQPSLTGNPCTLPKHDSDKEHSSGVRYVAACDCGNMQGPREDPYSLKQANHSFYVTLAEQCVCGQRERIDFPVFQPSTKEFRAANLFTNTVVVKMSRSQDVMSPPDKLSVTSAESDLLCPSKSGLSPTHPSDSNDIVLDLLDEQDSSKDKSLVRQPSTTEYLPSMLTMTSPSGLLPQFPSWSLVCLGPSSLYSHNLGLTESQHPGFLPGSNFLLPWDVTIRSANKQSWPPVNDSRKYQYNNPALARTRKSKSSSNLCDITVKVFVGIEYECPRGDRFMMSSSDKVLRATSGIVKESGHKVTTSDMPLYFSCPCRPNKPLVAQLMRIHVVSPKNLVYITLNPRVQPAAGAPIFIPGTLEPVKLTQSTYWVLRLPYVYVADKEPFLPPLNAPDSTAKLLQGMWGIVDT